MKQSSLRKKIAEILGIGPITAAAVVAAVGDTYLRTLLIHGARAVLHNVTAKTDPLSIWFQQLISRRGYNCAALRITSFSPSRANSRCLSGAHLALLEPRRPTLIGPRPRA